MLLKVSILIEQVRCRQAFLELQSNCRSVCFPRIVLWWGISNHVENCIIPLDNEVDMEHMCDGTVTLDGDVLECNGEWHLVDSKTLELKGEACETLKNGQAHDVTASWQCAEDPSNGPYIP